MKLRTMLVAAAASFLPFAAFADGHEEVQDLISDVWIFHVESEDMADFSDGMEAFWKAREKAGDDATWYAYRPLIGKNMNRVHYRRIAGQWADMDAYQEKVAAYETGDVFRDKVAPHVEYTERYIEESDLEHSHWPDGANGPFYGVTTWYLDESVSPQAGEARRAVSKMLKDGWASDENNWMWMYRYGGKSVLQMVTSFDSWAAMAEPEVTVFDFMMEKMESEEAVMGMFSDFSTGKVASDYTVWRLDEDLSYNLPDME
ncbi:MAG: hypothetical protein AAGA33_11485 [Pseudomonadota bacterium]